MIQIRQNVFETNSSSTHSFVMCDSDTWMRFAAGELFYNVLSRYHPENLEEYPLEQYKWVPEDSCLNDLPIFVTFKQIKNYLGDRSYHVLNNAVHEKKVNKDAIVRVAHKLLYASETFYSIDELEDYDFDSKACKASLHYFFG